MVLSVKPVIPVSKRPPIVPVTISPKTPTPVFQETVGVAVDNSIFVQNKILENAATVTIDDTTAMLNYGCDVQARLGETVGDLASELASDYINDVLDTLAKLQDTSHYQPTPDDRGLLGIIARLLPSSDEQPQQATLTIIDEAVDKIGTILPIVADKIVNLDNLLDTINTEILPDLDMCISSGELILSKAIDHRNYSILAERIESLKLTKITSASTIAGINMLRDHHIGIHHKCTNFLLPSLTDWRVAVLVTNTGKQNERMTLNDYETGYREAVLKQIRDIHAASNQPGLHQPQRPPIQTSIL